MSLNLRHHSLLNLSLPLCIVLLILYCGNASATEIPDKISSEESLRIGQRIYNLGILPSGKLLNALVQGDVTLTGDQVSCVNCHQRSGMGSSESRQQILPITKQTLYQRTQVGRSEVNIERLKNHLKQSRPIYTDATLGKVIREGIDPNGRQLNPLMPKFIFNSDNLKHLTNYIKSLSANVSPGVTNSTIHFATIITDEVDKRKRNAMLDILSAFTKAKNANTRNETGRKKYGPFFKEPHNSAYRKWALHTWHLKGEPNSWEKQLDELYETQAVFAILNGISSKSWAPIHQFCNSKQIPCLFPNTDLPVINENDFYSLYFSKGLSLEANTLAKYIKQNVKVKPISIIQVHGDNAEEVLTAQYFSRAVKANSAIKLSDYNLTKDAQSFSTLKTLISKNNPSILILWLKKPNIQKLEKLIRSNTLDQVILSSSLIDSQYQSIPESLYDKLLLTYPFDTPKVRKHLRMKRWIRTRGIEISDERIQANAFFTVKTASDALMHIRTNLYRDYFVERIEHMIDNSLITSVYPRLSLGPGQRFASKGCYIVKLSQDKKNLIIPVSEWIIP